MMVDEASPIPSPTQTRKPILKGAAKARLDAKRERMATYISMRDGGVTYADAASKMKLSPSTANRYEVSYSQMRGLPSEGLHKILSVSDIARYLSKAIAIGEIPVQYMPQYANALVGVQKEIEARKQASTTRSTRPIDALISSWSSELDRRAQAVAQTPIPSTLAPAPVIDATSAPSPLAEAGMPPVSESERER